jgi:SAM-dependent methyltransferase
MDPDSVLGYWDHAAPQYSASRLDGPLGLCALYEPVVEELVGEIANRRVLDVGCGDGHFARTLAARGARVTAVDGSREMLALATRHADAAGIEYCIADLTKALPLPDRAFDVIVANMVLMDLPEIDTAITESARVLAPGGRLVFSLTHPCFFSSDWVHDAHGAKLHKAVGDYLSPTVERLDFWGTTLHFHRPLSAYFDALARAGFAVDAFKEPMPSDACVEQRPEWQHHRRVPSFIVVRAVLR